MKRSLCLLLLATGCQGGPAPPAAGNDPHYRWFSVPLEVAKLPASREAVPVRREVDFSALLQDLKVSGIVDERSLHLLHDGKEEPVQFTSAPQPRAKQRRLLPGTPATVSLAAEYDAQETPPVRVAGTLTWLARSDAAGQARYQLRFGVLRAGRAVQVPFPPQNLRCFDASGQATPLRHFPRLQLRPQWPRDGVVHFHDDRQLVTSYHLGPKAVPGAGEVRRPFLYPVHGPDGIPLTEFGKPHDPTGSHAHHYSLWVAHASVNGQDFWSERGGAIVHKQLELQEDGPIFCRLVQRAVWELAGTELLHERRTITLYRGFAKYRLVDVELELAPAKEAVTFGKTSFGFLAARVAQPMTVFDGGGEIRNARGQLNEHACHLQKADWIDQSGPIAPGKWGGLALLDHPDNPNHPTGWHCRNDGWAGAAFNLDGPTTLAAGQSLKLRYRVHLHQGNAVTGEVARRFEEYRAAPVIELGKSTHPSP